MMCVYFIINKPLSLSMPWVFTACTEIASAAAAAATYFHFLLSGWHECTPHNPTFNHADENKRRDQVHAVKVFSICHREPLSACAQKQNRDAAAAAKPSSQWYRWCLSAAMQSTVAFSWVPRKFPSSQLFALFMQLSDLHSWVLHEKLLSRAAKKRCDVFGIIALCH